ncbi:MAG: tetratricopeptide repeat-containing serine protease family protein [Coleofasciculus sp. C1-SOL-03]|uniref:tetratricopeptide repeat protein n=1 Tax=Coleofasciculus sp. C1-SOL-03 TaxID=3069522 RepID=UPI0032F50246
MTFSYRFPATIIGMAATIVMVQPQITVAATADEIRNTAKEITVLIRENGKNVGSGVIIARSGDTHYILTAKHVVPNKSAPPSYEVIAPDGSSSYEINDTSIVRLDGVDLAIVPFISKKHYKIATIFDKEEKVTIHDDDSTTKSSQRDQPVVVAGYPIDVSHPGEPVLTLGLLLDKEAAFSTAQNPFDGGYELFYTNATQKGMSGSPVLDADGRVIGIHGQTEGDSTNNIEFGHSLGIPIHAFLQRASSTFKTLGVTAASLEPPEIKDYPANQLPEEDIEKLSGGSVSSCPIDNSISIEELAQRGNRLYRLKRYRESLECFNKIIKINPDYRIAWYARGFLLSQHLEKLEQGLNSLEEATKIDPNYHTAWRWKGVVLYKLGRYEEALTSFEQAIKNYSHGAYYQAWYGKGQAFGALGRHEESLAAFEIASLDQSSYAALIKQGDGFFYFKKYEEALKSYEMATAINDNNYEAWLKKAKSLKQLKRYYEAIIDLDIGLNITQIQPSLWLEKGHVLRQIQRYQESLQAYERVINLDPENYEAWFYKGWILQYGDVPKNIAKLWQQYLQAIASYDKVIQIMHDYQLAVENKELAEKVLMNIARACYANIENMSNSPKPRLHLSNIYRHPNEQPENLYFNMQLQQDVNDYYREGRFNEGIINTPLWELNFDINNPPKEMLDSRMDVDVRASGDVFCIKLP